MSSITTPIEDLVAYDVSTDPPISELQVAVGHSTFGGTPKRAEYSAMVTNPVTVLLGSELLPSTGWTMVDWTGSFAAGFDHTTGNTTALSNTLAAIVDNIYLISYIVSGWTTGTFDLSFGGVTSADNSATSSETFKALSTANLVVTPTTDFDGTIVFSIKQITWELTEAEILDILGVSDVVQSSALAAYALAVSGKSLVLDSIIANLPQCLEIDLPAGASIADKITTATKPTGWTLAATGEGGKNLQITHNLSNVTVDIVTIKATTESGNQTLINFKDAYSQILELANVVTIVGLADNDLPLIIKLAFS